MSTLSERLIGLLVAEFGLPEGEVGADLTFDEMGLDSLALIEFSIVIKKHTGVLLDDVELPSTATVTGIAALIESKGVAV
jgi:acyl carrier protein